MKHLLRFGLLACFLGLAFAASGARPALAALTFTVNQTVDEDDANRFDDRCDSRLFSTGDQCSLRAAIQQANYSAGTDTIRFVSSAVHGLARSGDDDDANRGDLDITASVIIEGHAPFTTIDANQIDRVFDIHAGTVTMRDLIVTGGSTPAFGGGYQVKAGVNLTLDNVIIRDNFAADNSGGMENFGTATLDHVTITNNETNDAIGGVASGRGSAPGTFTLRNSTIMNNGGFDADIGGTSSVTNSTLGDTAAFGSMSVRNATIQLLRLCDLNGNCGNAGATGLFNTILGGCLGSFNSLGYNLVENTAGCTLTGNQAGNLFNVDAKLGRLANNGGPTATRALTAGSPAIDAGNPSGCVFGNNVPLTTDQRGFVRPTDGNGDSIVRCDIGAFEVGAVGVGSVAPDKGVSEVGEQVVFDLAWDSPTRWRDLHTVDLRFREGKLKGLWLRFTEGLPTSTFSLLDAQGNVVDSGNAGQAKVLQNKFGALNLAASGFTASGPNDPHVVLHFAVTFKRQAHYKIQMLATDDFANAQGPEPAGKWKVNN